MRPSASRALLLLACLASSALAGCVGGEDAPGPGGESNATATAPPGGAALVDAAGEDGAPVPGPDAEGPLTLRTLHVAADMRLVDELPAAGSVPMSGSYARCFAQGQCDFLVFESAPLARDILIPPQTVVVRYFMEASAPVAPGPFGFAAWFGSTLAMPLFAITEQSGPVMPGAPLEVEVPLALEGDPIAIPAGASLRLYAISGGLHEGTGILNLLTGGETASSVTFTFREVTLPAPAAPRSETKTGALLAPGFPAGDVVPDEHHLATHLFTLGADLTRVQVDLRLTSSARMDRGDLDVDVYLGDTLLGGGHSPLPMETVYLAGPVVERLAGAELRVVVSNFDAPQAEYEVTVTQS